MTWYNTILIGLQSNYEQENKPRIMTKPFVYFRCSRSAPARDANHFRFNGKPHIIQPKWGHSIMSTINVLGIRNLNARLQIQSTCQNLPLPKITYFAPSVSKAALNSFTAVSASSKFSAEMAHLACFCAFAIARSSVISWFL